jgi:hypothetical protein
MPPVWRAWGWRLPGCRTARRWPVQRCWVYWRRREGRGSASCWREASAPGCDPAAPAFTPRESGPGLRTVTCGAGLEIARMTARRARDRCDA